MIHTGPADRWYYKHQEGNKTSLRFGGFKTTAIRAIIRLLGYKKDKGLLMKIRLLEQGAFKRG